MYIFTDTNVKLDISRAFLCVCPLVSWQNIYLKFNVTDGTRNMVARWWEANWPYTCYRPGVLTMTINRCKLGGIDDSSRIIILYWSRNFLYFRWFFILILLKFAYICILKMQTSVNFKRTHTLWFGFNAHWGIYYWV